MSIITQALKKAQHEQRLQPAPQAPYGSLTAPRPQAYEQPSSHRRSRSRLVVAGVGLLCGIGMAIYMAQPIRDPLPVAMTVPAAPQPTPDSRPSRSQAASAPSPPALEPRPPALRQPVAPPSRPRVSRAAAPSASLPLTPRPALPAAQRSTLRPPEQAPQAEPNVSPAEKRAQAKQYFNNGIEAYHTGAIDEAEAALQQAIALDPTFKRAFNRLGNLYYQRDAFRKALAMYQQALALDPNYIDARNNLGNTYMQLDMSAKAIAELNKAIAVDRESGLTYYNMACAYARMQEPEKAIRYLEMAITREPEARQWAKTDTDFTAVRSISAFQKLLGTSS